jgi:hypothetical protein
VHIAGVVCTVFTLLYSSPLLYSAVHTAASMHISQLDLPSSNSNTTLLLLRDPLILLILFNPNRSTVYPRIHHEAELHSLRVLVRGHPPLH